MTPSATGDAAGAATTLAHLQAALGPPLARRTIGGGLATVVRWSHDGVRLDLRGIDRPRLVLDISGRRSVEFVTTTGTAQHPVRAGTVTFVPPGVAGDVIVRGPADTVQIVFAESFGVHATTSPAEASIRATAFRALVALADDDRGREDSLLAEELRTCVRRLRDDTVPSDLAALDTASLARVDAIVDERIACGAMPTLEELAAVPGYDVDHFTRLFRRSRGTTPYAFACERRLAAALAMVLDGDERFAEIAEATGFASPSHFGEALRAHVGASPGALRRAARR